MNKALEAHRALDSWLNRYQPPPPWMFDLANTIRAALQGDAIKEPTPEMTLALAEGMGVTEDQAQFELTCLFRNFLLFTYPPDQSGHDWKGSYDVLATDFEARGEIIAELEKEVERLKEDDRLAMEVIERQKEEVYLANQKSRELEVQLHTLKACLAKAVEVLKPFADEGSQTDQWTSTQYYTDVGGSLSDFTVGDLRAAAQFVREQGE